MYKGNKQRHFKGHALYGVTEGARCKKTSRAILAWPDMPCVHRGHDPERHEAREGSGRVM